MTPERWRQVQELFDQALPLAADVRSDFLQRATGNDADLRREVESLLDAELRAADFIDEALDDSLDLFLTSEEAPMPRTLDRYQIQAEIGRGGCGKVYRAYDPLLERTVAIKTCTAKDSVWRRRFLREGRLSVELRHANIVDTFDFGQDGNHLFLVQELLDGEDLDRLIARRAPMAMTDKLDCLLQIADALAYAHGKKVLHRDVKPGNIRVLPDGRIKILDFGIACLMDESQRLTLGRTTVGTVAYMAPERLCGHGLDERSDIFSFGVLAYELLAGRQPFPGHDFAEVSDKILSTRPKGLRRVAPDVSRPVARLVRQCLAKRPDERFADFEHVAGQLKQAKRLQGAPGLISRLLIALASLRRPGFSGLRRKKTKKLQMALSRCKRNYGYLNE